MEQDNSTIPNVFQQLGQIQGTLTALNANMSNFQIEFRTATNEQNKKIESLRKEVSDEIKDLSNKVEELDKFRANYEGGRAEAKKNARVSGAFAGGGVGISGALVVEIIKYLISFHK